MAPTSSTQPSASSSARSEPMLLPKRLHSVALPQPEAAGGKAAAAGLEHVSSTKLLDDKAFVSCCPIGAERFGKERWCVLIAAQRGECCRMGCCAVRARASLHSTASRLPCSAAQTLIVMVKRTRNAKCFPEEYVALAANMVPQSVISTHDCSGWDTHRCSIIYNA